MHSGVTNYPVTDFRGLKNVLLQIFEKLNATILKNGQIFHSEFVCLNRLEYFLNNRSLPKMKIFSMAKNTKESRSICSKKGLEPSHLLTTNLVLV